MLDSSSQPNLDAPEDASWSVRFWLLIAATGVLAGLAGGALMALLHQVEHVAWNYRLGSLLDAEARAPATRHVLMLMAAGVLVGFGRPLIRRFFGRTHAVEADIWFRSGRVSPLPTIAGALLSIVTVGMGVSLGRESPIKQAAGAIASRLALLSRLPRAEQRVLVACGVGAGMAAAYNVPVGGALFAVEVLLGSISLRLALPALLCSGIGTCASWVFLPSDPIYSVPEFPLSPQLVVWSLIAGPILGLATVPLVRAIGWGEAHKPGGRMTGFAVPLAVMTILGVASIAFPQLLGNGKDIVQVAFSNQFDISLLLVLPILKLVATVASLGSGASGGLFTPTMSIGALLGGLLGHTWNRIWPGASMGSCSVVGSCAFLAAASQGPISALVLVLELTRHVDATMAPMLLAVAGAMLTARILETRSIYSIRYAAKALSKSVGAETNGVVSQDFRSVSSAKALSAVAVSLVSEGSKSRIYVLDGEGVLLGAVDASSLRNQAVGGVPFDALKAGDVAVGVTSLTSSMSEGEFKKKLADSGEEELAVVDDATGRMSGVVSFRTVHEIAAP